MSPAYKCVTVVPSVARNLLFLFCFLAPPAFAQGPATGTPPFGSFSGGPDVINLGNLNAHLTVPVLHKPGRVTSFDYDLSFDSSVWYPVTSGSTKSWQPAYNWGWRAQTEIAVGYISFTGLTSLCTEGGGSFTTFTNYVYHDIFGTPHPFPGGSIVSSGPCATNHSINAIASDASGYTISGTGGGVQATAANGTIIKAPVVRGTGAGSFIDRNGNKLSVDASGNFTDTLGTTVLTVSGSGTPASPMTFTYTAPSSASAAYKVIYTSYPIQTNFGCTGITEYGSNGTTTANLISEIDLPNYSSSSNPNSRYLFSYEPTPSHSGFFTGRLTSVTLPSGGTISYTYTGGNNGITCADGSTSGLKRFTPDSGTNFWQYDRAPGNGAAYVTTVTDPSGNQTKIQFQGNYETERQVYQGSISGTLLSTIDTCYNNAASPCTTTPVTSPITQKAVVNKLPGTNNLQSKTVWLYNLYGLQTELDEYDFGSGAPSSAPLRMTLTTYASLGNGILGMPASVTIKDGAGNIKAQTKYMYDESAVTATTGTPQLVAVTGSRGNATTVQRYVDSVNFLMSKATFFDTGTVQTATDVNNAVTTYTYGACGNSFPTNVGEPLSLSRQETWNCTGGVPLTVTDENGKTTTTAYSDPFFWRPASIADPSGAITSYCYGLLSGGTCIINPNQVEMTLNFNSGNSTVDMLVTTDGLGRTFLRQTRQGPSSANFDTVETDYDSLGRVRRSTLPFSATAAQANSSAPAKTTTYDALNRRAAVNDAGGGNATYAYSQNDMFVTTGPAPTGENTKRRQLEYDALGHLTSVCEVTSASGSGSCGQSSIQTGYWTKYSYDILGDLTGVTQNSQAATANQQSRIYSFDFLSRLTSETNPESGTTSYAFDSASGCAGTFPGDLVKRVDAVGNITCLAYDALHRKLSMTYPSGSYASATPGKYFVYDNATLNGTGMTNSKGRLAEAYTCTTCPGSKLTDVGFSYSTRGEISDTYQSTPHSAGYYHLTQTYWANGAANQLSGLPGLPTITYGGTIGATVGLDGEGRITQVTASTGQNPLTGRTFNLYSTPPTTSATFGSSDSDQFTFDSNTNRMTQYKFNVGTTQSVTGGLVWNANGSLSQLAVTDPFNSANTQTCVYGYDDLKRLAGANCGAAWSGSYTFDPFGNITKSGTLSFQASYAPATNHMTLIGTFTPTYDANGNVLNDGAHTYTWDANGNSITTDGVGLTFDALNRMVEQNRSGSYTEIVYWPTGAKLALMNGQSLVTGFISLPGGANAVYNSLGLDHYRHPDWLGSNRLSSTSSRTVQWSGAYGPWGELYASSGTSDSSFTGKNSDTSSTEYDFLYRQYGTQGRWTSPDPAGLSATTLLDPQSWNRYAYVSNLPTGRVDSLGTIAHPATRYGGSCGDDFSGECGRGSGCKMDFVYASCSMVQNALMSGAAMRCPNDICEGVNKFNLPTQFVATALGGAYACLAPGEWATQREAGTVGTACANPISIITGTEYVGNIYSIDKNGRYSFTKSAGDSGSVDFDPSDIPDGTEYAGSYHTHGDGLDPRYDNEHFSDFSGDLGIAISDENKGFPIYLGTPGGRIEMYDPSKAGQFPLGCVLVGSPIPAAPGLFAVPNC